MTTWRVQAPSSARLPLSFDADAHVHRVSAWWQGLDRAADRPAFGTPCRRRSRRCLVGIRAGQLSLPQALRVLPVPMLKTGVKSSPRSSSSRGSLLPCRPGGCGPRSRRARRRRAPRPAGVLVDLRLQVGDAGVSDEAACRPVLLDQAVGDVPGPGRAGAGSVQKGAEWSRSGSARIGSPPWWRTGRWCGGAGPWRQVRVVGVELITARVDVVAAHRDRDVAEAAREPVDALIEVVALRVGDQVVRLSSFLLPALGCGLPVGSRSRRRHRASAPTVASASPGRRRSGSRRRTSGSRRSRTGSRGSGTSAIAVDGAGAGGDDVGRLARRAQGQGRAGSLGAGGRCEEQDEREGGVASEDVRARRGRHVS